MPTLLPLLFLIIIFVLSIRSLVHVFRYHKTKDSVYLYKIFYIWRPLIALAVIITILYLLFGPLTIDKERIIGNYQIDTSFYSGANANWQKKHFRFHISNDDTFTFYEKLADGNEREYIGKVFWSARPPVKWSVKMYDYHQVVDNNPTLYRSNRKFYYVFHSRLFGNMFFRKTDTAANKAPQPTPKNGAAEL